MPLDMTLNADEYAPCIITSDDKGRFVRKDPRPAQPAWWDRPAPKDNPIKDLEIDGSGGNDVAFRQPWDGMRVAIRSNVFDSVRQFIKDLFAAAGQISAGAIAAGVKDGAEALNRLFGPEQLRYVVYWQFSFDLGPENALHYVLVQHRNRYRAVLGTSPVAVPGAGGSSTVAQTSDFTWRWKEQVQIRHAPVPCDTQKTGGQTTEIVEFAHNAALVRLRSQKGILVEAETEIGLDFKGLTSQLGAFEKRLRGLFDRVTGLPEGTPPPAQDTAGVTDMIRLIEQTIDALLRTWEGEIELQSTVIQLTCITAAAYARLQAEIARAAAEPAAGGASPKTAAPGATLPPPAPRLGIAQYALAALKPGDSLVYYVPAAGIAEGELPRSQGFRHVRLSLMHDEEVASFYRALAAPSGRQEGADVPVQGWPPDHVA